MLRIIRYLKRYEAKHVPLLVIGLSTTIWAIGDGIFEYHLPIFLESIVKNISLVGLLLALPSIISLLVDVPIGLLAHRMRIKHFFLMSLGAFFIILLLLNFWSNIYFIVIFLLIYGISFDAIAQSAFHFIVRRSDEKSDTEDYGVYHSLRNLGFLIGAFFAGYILTSDIITPVQFTTFTTLLAFFLVFYFLKENRPQRVKFHKKGKSHFKAVFKLLKYPRLLITLVALSVLTFWDGLIWTMEPLYISQFIGDQENNWIIGGIILASFVLPLVLFEPLAGVIARKVGKIRLAFFGFIIIPIMGFMFGWLSNIFYLIPVAFVSSLGFAMAWPALEGLFTDFAKEHSMGDESIGLMDLFINFGYIFAPIIGGLLASQIGFSKTFMLISSIILIVILFFWFFIHKLSLGKRII